MFGLGCTAEHLSWLFMSVIQKDINPLRAAQCVSALCLFVIMIQECSPGEVLASRLYMGMRVSKGRHIMLVSLGLHSCTMTKGGIHG